MTDFLFHKVSEKEREEIKKEAKDLLESFSKKLSKIKGKTSESFIERDKGEREEGKTGKKESNDFRERMFENSPRKNKDFILAEKKGW